MQETLGLLIIWLPRRPLAGAIAGCVGSSSVQPAGQSRFSGSRSPCLRAGFGAADTGGRYPPHLRQTFAAWRASMRTMVKGGEGDRAGGCAQSPLLALARMLRERELQVHPADGTWPVPWPSRYSGPDLKPPVQLPEFGFRGGQMELGQPLPGTVAARRGRRTGTLASMAAGLPEWDWLDQAWLCFTGIRLSVPAGPWHRVDGRTDRACGLLLGAFIASRLEASWRIAGSLRRGSAEAVRRQQALTSVPSRGPRDCSFLPVLKRS